MLASFESWMCPESLLERVTLEELEAVFAGVLVQPVEHLAVVDVGGFADLVARLPGRCGEATLAGNVALIEPRLLFARAGEGIDARLLARRRLRGLDRAAEPIGEGRAGAFDPRGGSPAVKVHGVGVVAQP